MHTTRAEEAGQNSARSVPTFLVIYLLKAPISSTATMVPTSIAVGSLKYFRKCGPVMTPDMTLSTGPANVRQHGLDGRARDNQLTLDHIRTCVRGSFSIGGFRAAVA